MPVIESASGVLAAVGSEAASALHVTQKPIPHGAGGHYRVTHRMALINLQGANSILYEFRNAHATNRAVTTGLRVSLLQTGAHTGAVNTSIDMCRRICTS